MMTTDVKNEAKELRNKKKRWCGTQFTKHDVSEL